MVGAVNNPNKTGHCGHPEVFVWFAILDWVRLNRQGPGGWCHGQPELDGIQPLPGWDGIWEGNIRNERSNPGPRQIDHRSHRRDSGEYCWV